ncbi:MAG: T9SS type A sorting domain-containing protein, partial [Bacteroidia bacterium]
EQGNNTPIQITWNKSENAVSYKWMATSVNGNFNAPLVVLPATDSILNLTSNIIDNTLKTLGVKRTDSVELKWTVYAYKSAADSLQANETRTIKLIRKRILGNFNLVNPVNNTRVGVEATGSANISITWTTSTNAIKYTWLAKTVSENFNAPLLNISSNNNGTATELTLAESAVDALLAANGIALGDSITLEWTVRATEPEDSILASQVNTITLVRTNNTGLTNIDISNKLMVYPNPTNNYLTITSNEILGSAQFSMMDLTGRLVLTSNINIDTNHPSVDVSTLNKGIYFVQIVTQQGTATYKVVIQ